MSEHHAAQSAPARLHHAAAHGLSPALLAALEAHREAERALEDAMARSGVGRSDAAVDPESTAEFAAWDAVLAVPVLSHADAVAMFAHIRQGVDVSPADCGFSMAVHLLTPFLGADAKTPAARQGPTLGRYRRETSPMVWAIASHRAAHAAQRARGDYEGGDPDEAWIALSHAELDGLRAVLAAPCVDRTDAAAVLTHLSRYLAAEKTGMLRDDGELACEVAETLCRALAVALAGEAEATHAASRTLM